jgi:hypothetical protein
MRISMSGEVSYFSRFFVKFVEIIGAGLASAVCAYVLAHFGGLRPSSSTPVSAPAPSTVQVGPTAVAATAVSEPRPAPQQDTDAAVAQPVPKAAKGVKTLRPRKHTKTDMSMTENKPRGQKSAEALARAALANVDANRPTPADAPIGRALTDTRPVPADVQPRPADVPPRQGEVQSRSVDFPPRPPMPVATPSPE